MSQACRDLQLKPHFAQTIERFEAWWRCERVDRPPASIWVERRREVRGPTKNHATLRERWMDAEFAVDSAIAWMESQDYVGDSFPMYMPNVGPELTATLLGCDLEFSEHTSWSTPIVHEPEGWHRVLKTKPRFDNPYWRVIEEMTDLALAKNHGRYVVGIADLHSSYDILAALRDPQMLCMDLMDCPALVEQAGTYAAQLFVASFNRLYQRIAAAGLGSTTWAPAYHSGPMYLPNCDFWCMVSHEVARDLIVPTLVTEMRPMARSLFHLDGPQALRHLDLVLDLPRLSGVQWVYGSGHGPASRWIDVYRRIREAKKCVQILAATPREALDVVEAIGARGVWLTIWNPFASVEEAEGFLGELARLAREDGSNSHGKPALIKAATP